MTEPANNQWPYPRHRDFQKHVRKAAANWFQQKGYATDPKHTYFLAERKNWKNNIILDDVFEFIRKNAGSQKNGENVFSLHRDIHSGTSSQGMLFNLVGPFLAMNDLTPLKNLVEKKGLLWPGVEAKACFEFKERKECNVFKEGRGHHTSIDLVISTQDSQPQIFIEAKFAEHEFGGCSVFKNGKCDGENPAKEHELCYYHRAGREYWLKMHKHGLDQGNIGSDSVCIMTRHFQFFRELLFALENHGVFVLLSDERSPVFQLDGPQGERGVMPLLMGLLPPELKHKVAMISIQELVAEIAAYQNPDWLNDFSEKYALESLPAA